MGAVKGVLPVVVSIVLILAVTAILWHINSIAGGSFHLVYFYLFPVALIAAVYKTRVAVLSTIIALFCADYFLQAPLFSLANDNPLEYGDLFVLALLAVPTIKFIRELVRPRAKSLKTRSRYRWG